MQETQRTLVYVGAAVVTVVLAAGTHWAMQPASLEEFSDVGEEFYPEFKDPNTATALRVAAYNEDAARVDVFNVEFKNGLWRIPSHHNYPADGEDRLAKTATSISGIERQAIVSTSADDFKRLGVLDPLDESVTGTEGRGDRITLLDGDNVLADYIIGHKVEGQENVYHVRRPDENRTYRAELNIDISTKFADWIEPGLLDVRRGDLRKIVIDRYSIDETRGVVVPGDVSTLTRASASDSWALEGTAENEEVKTSEVNSIINALEDLTIVGVRPKPPGLSADLKGESEAQLDTLSFIDLQEKGYFVDRQGALVSNEGEVRVGTAEGVLYVLRFGEVFTGSDVEIEVGQSQEDDGDAETTSDAADDQADASESESADEGEADSESQKQSRYLFITTQFDESLIEGPGDRPVEPEPPAEDSEPDAAEEADAANDESEVEQTDAEAEDAAEADDGPEGDADEQPSADEQYQQALEEYESQLAQWESAQQAYEAKLDDGRERVAELNTRFADWYYVISADSFDDIRVARSELVEVQEPEEDAPPEGAAESSASEGPASAPPVPDVESEETGEPAESEDSGPASSTASEPDADESSGSTADAPDSRSPAGPQLPPASPDQPRSDQSPPPTDTADEPSEEPSTD